MEKEIVWTAIAQKDFWEIAAYLKDRFVNPEDTNQLETSQYTVHQIT